MDDYDDIFGDGSIKRKRAQRVQYTKTPARMREESEARNKALRLEQEELTRRPAKVDGYWQRARVRCAMALNERDRINKLHGRKMGGVAR